MSLDPDRRADLGALLEWAATEAEANAPNIAPQGHTPWWGVNATNDLAAYRAWWAARGREMTARPLDGVGGTRFTIVVWLAGAPTDELPPCVGSIQGQTSPHWETVLIAPSSDVDRDGSDPLSELAASDRRFRVNRRGGTSESPEVAFSGDYIAFVAWNDLLDPDALARVGEVVAPDVDVVYTDEDQINANGLHSRPVFKPDWAPDLLLSQPYLGGLLVVSRSVLENLQEDADPDADAEYDLMLRATEAARRIVHIPDVLYHRRAGTQGPGADPERAKVALQRALERRGLDATVEAAERRRSWRVRWAIKGEPSVSIVIPFRDQASLLAKCVESIPVSPGYDNYEIVLVDNGSVEPETRALRTRLAQRDGVTVVEHPGAFNWSAINNAGAAASSSDLLLFLNNDIEAVGDGWLRALVEEGQRAEVGAVGARLLYPDGATQHAGIVLGVGVVCWHVFMWLPPEESAYLDWDRVVRPCEAVTGACLLTRRDVFAALGGFDESLEVAFNDVDYCMRAVDLGYRVLYTPHAVLVHDEATSRGMAGYRADGRRFLAKWDRSRLRDDPYFNKNLSRFRPWCALREPWEDAQWEIYVDEEAGTGA